MVQRATPSSQRNLERNPACMKSIFESLRKTRNSVFGQIVNLFGAGEIDDSTWDDIESLLIQGDVGVETTLALVERLRHRVEAEGIYRTQHLHHVLREEIRSLMPDPDPLNLD